MGGSSGVKMEDYTPYYFSKFKPFGYQRQVLDLVYNYDYRNLYYPEIMLSGAVGSAKSSLLAHIAISHCLRLNKARVGISRMGLPDLKKTLFREILDAIENDPAFIEGVHYKVKHNNAEIVFANGSHIMPVTFGDRNWGKVKSYLFSLVLIEEGTEYDDEFYEGEDSGFDLLRGRINRLRHVKESALIIATNPGEPDHHLYDYFIQGEKNHHNRFVFYSETDKNPYLDPNYIMQLRGSYSELMAERYLRGRWISLAGKGIYHSYTQKLNYRDELYIPKPELPIHICYDFNIGHGKPMSAVVFQELGTDYHFFAESIIDDSLWSLDCLEDLESRKILRHDQKIFIHGDATGNSRSSNAKFSNYELIRDWLTHRSYEFEIQVPRSNPPITTRHVKVNALCKNDLGQVRLYVYRACPTLDRGLKLTKFKKNTHIEDDSKRYQHCTTSAAYGLYARETIRSKDRSTFSTRG